VLLKPPRLPWGWRCRAGFWRDKEGRRLKQPTAGAGKRAPLSALSAPVPRQRRGCPDTSSISYVNILIYPSLMK